MKKFKVLLSGKIIVHADTEDQAIEHAEKEIKSIHSKSNAGILEIGEIRGEEQQ